MIGELDLEPFKGRLEITLAMSTDLGRTYHRDVAVLVAEVERLRATRDEQARRWRR